jgi:hypothetical protein
VTVEDKLVVSRKRVVDHGEVYTPKKIVNAMFDLVAQEAERIDSRFLEPACGTGNFLSEVLSRKLKTVAVRYSKNRMDYERYSFIALSSIYGIDILEDNVVECRERLLSVLWDSYSRLCKVAPGDEFQAATAYVAERNIVWGDALTLKTVAGDPQPIVFSEWSPVNSYMIKRRDFAFHELLSQARNRELPLFSDLGEEAFIPEPIAEYPVVHYLRVADVKQC